MSGNMSASNDAFHDMLAKNKADFQNTLASSASLREWVLVMGACVEEL